MTKDEVKIKAEWISSFYFEECATCGVPFASPLLNKRSVDGESFYCPVGHVNVFSEARKDKEQRERERNRLAVEEEELYRMMHPKPTENKKSFWKRNK